MGNSAKLSTRKTAVPSVRLRLPARDGRGLSFVRIFRRERLAQVAQREIDVGVFLTEEFLVVDFLLTPEWRLADGF